MKKILTTFAAVLCCAAPSYNSISVLQASPLSRPASIMLIDCYNQFEILPWSLPGVYADGAFTVGENIADLGGFLIAYETYLRHLREAGFTGEQYDLQRRRFYLAYAWQMHGKYSVMYAHDLTLGADDNPSTKDTHSLFRERVNGVVMNTDDWYELFPIQPEDKLYRKDGDRVRIW